MTPNVIRVLIADDHPVFRDGMKAILQTPAARSAVEVIGEATTGVEAIRIATQLRPDVIVMDVHMPELNGIDATRTITAHHHDIAVLILTMLEDDDSVFAALRAGAHGYLLKGADDEEILRAITAVADGEAIFGAPIAQRVIEFFSAGAKVDSKRPFPQLTIREHEILALIARGTNNRSIATRLGITDKTVRNHVSTIFSKLHVADRGQAIVKAREAGLQ